MAEPTTLDTDPTAAAGIPADLRGPLLRYRILAWTVGVGLIILVFVGIPLQIWAHDSVVEAIVGTAHGWLYMVYLVFVFLLSRRAGWSASRTIVVALAGTIPIGSFVAERYVTRWVRESR